MLNANNPFVFASSSAADPLAPTDAIMSAPGMPQSFVWSHLLVTVALEAPVLPQAVPTAEPAQDIAAIPSDSTSTADVAPEPVVAAPVVNLAPPPALITIAEPAPLPAPVHGLLPNAAPEDATFDAYARLFQGIEDRDMLPDLHALLPAGSVWMNAFGPPLG
ncbi:MAG: hypothetical protein V4653_09920 [Pseudomonadota bacterium]